MRKKPRNYGGKSKGGLFFTCGYNWSTLYTRFASNAVFFEKENNMSESAGTVVLQKEELGVKREYQWYVYLHESARANEIVARALGAGADHEDRLRRGVVCMDGKAYSLWSVTFPEVRMVKSASNEFGFRVTTFVQEGQGAPRAWYDPVAIRRRKALLKKKVHRGL